MKKIIVSEFLTLDGVMEAPEKWNSNYLTDEELVKDILDNFSECDSLLFGLTTYEFFASRWPTRTGEIADKFNNLPKYVVSTTLQKTEWNNSTIISADACEEIKKLKEEAGKNIFVFGSYKLVQTMIKNNLIDEYKLYFYPLTLGTGKRLFTEGMTAQTLKFINARVFRTGTISAVYQIEKTLK